MIKNGKIKIFKIERANEYKVKKEIDLWNILPFFYIFLFTISLLYLTPTIQGIEESKNFTNYENATKCLNESRFYMEELKQANFSIQRVNDTLKELENIYEAQQVLIKVNEADFSLVLPYCEEIKNIKDDAFKSKDELDALLEFYDNLLEEGMNTSSVDLMISEIKNEIFSERYEKVKPLVDKTYEEIVNVKAEHAALNLFYKTTTRNIKDFFKDNWIYLVSLLIFLAIFYIVYRKAIRRWRINSKIRNLEIRKKTLKELIQNTQRDYFEKGIMSEGDYTIRTKKFAEMIREVDRDIPLLKEELVKASNRKGDIFEMLNKEGVEKTKEDVKKVEAQKEENQKIQKIKKVIEKKVKKQNKKNKR